MSCAVLISWRTAKYSQSFILALDVAVKFSFKNEEAVRRRIGQEKSV